MRDRRALIAVVVALLSVAGLLVYGLTRGSGELTTEGPSGSRASTTSLPDGAPEWQVAAIRVNNGLNELFMNPDPGRLADFVDPECPCFVELTERLAKMKANGHRYDRSTLDIVSAALVDRPGPDEMRVALRVRAPGPRLVDADNQVVRAEEETYGQVDHVLRKTPDGQWRLLRSVQPVSGPA